MLRKWWGITLLLMALVMVLAAGCGQAQEPSPTPVVSAPAQEAPMGFAMAGQVEAVEVDLGDEVQAGDTLVSLEASRPG